MPLLPLSRVNLSSTGINHTKANQIVSGETTHDKINYLAITRY